MWRLINISFGTKMAIAVLMWFSVIRPVVVPPRVFPCTWVQVQIRTSRNRTAGFNPCFYLPGFGFVVTLFLTHSHIAPFGSRFVCRSRSSPSAGSLWNESGACTARRRSSRLLRPESPRKRTPAGVGVFLRCHGFGGFFSEGKPCFPLL